MSQMAWSDVVTCQQFYGLKFDSVSSVRSKCTDGLCHTNVLSVASNLTQMGVPKSEIKFLLLMPNHLNDHLYPQAHTDKSNTYWNYHVLVRVGLHIFDIDHKGNAAPIRVETYFKEMFGKGNIDFKQIEVRTFSHEDYLGSIGRFGELAIAYNRYSSSIPTDSLNDVLADLGMNVKDIQRRKIKSKAGDALSPIAERFENMLKLFNQFKAKDSIVFMYEIPPNGAPAIYDGIFHAVHSRSVVVVGPKRNLIEIPFETIIADSVTKP